MYDAAQPPKSNLGFTRNFWEDYCDNHAGFNQPGLRAPTTCTRVAIQFADNRIWFMWQWELELLFGNSPSALHEPSPPEL